VFAPVFLQIAGVALMSGSCFSPTTLSSRERVQLLSIKSEPKVRERFSSMSAGTDKMVAGPETEAGADIASGSKTLQGEAAEEIRAARPTSKLHVLRAAILMSADSMLADLRAIREAKTLEEAQAPVNPMIDRVMALSQAAEVAAE
jgi:hypothetical protein